MNSWYHAVSASREWGGAPDDYLPVEEFIDSSKQVLGDARHRALYHHTLGVFVAERIFGKTLEVATEAGRTRRVPVRLVAERHILEDLGRLPSPADYLRNTQLEPWMSGALRRELPLSHLIRESASDRDRDRDRA